MPLLTNDCINKINMAVKWGDVLTPSPKYAKEFNCPFCGSSHHVTVHAENNTAYCQKCGKSFNAIQAVQEVLSLDFPTACRELAEHYGINLEFEKGSEPEAGRKEAREKQEKPLKEAKTEPEESGGTTYPGKYKEFIEGAINDIRGGLDYLHTRGLDDAIINAYKLGYMKGLYFVNAGEKKPAIIFPHSADYSYYSARSLDGKYFSKPPEREAGKEPLYNAGALYKKKPCFVCEGQIDALSIIQAGGNAVALDGTAYENNLLKTIDKRPPEATLILSLDNDKPGKDGKRPGPEAQEALAKELRERGIKYIEACYDYSVYSGSCKDANDLLRSNRAQLEKDIKANETAALDDTGIEGFLLQTNSRRFEPVPTGLKKIDDILHGGFIPQSLVLLGGPPGSGKTIFANMIFEEMAKNGREGIYINLEMSKEQLLARSLSRRIYKKNNRYVLTSLDILQGYKLTGTQKELVRDAAEEYKREVGDKLQYNPEFCGTDIDKLIKGLEGQAEKAEAEGKAAPNICLDYLHLLTGQPGEDTSSVIKRAVFLLKEYAKKHNAIVFAIEAQSREANRKDTATLEAGRDTSGLEYSGDLILQLVQEKEDAKNEVHLCITKSRFTETNEKGYLFTKQGEVSYMEAQ